MAQLDGQPYRPTYFRCKQPIIASVVSDPIRELIDSRKRGWEGNLGDLGARVVEKQIEVFHEAQEEARLRGVAPLSLLEQSAAKIIESFTGSEDDIRALTSLPAQLAQKFVWESEKLPYTAFRLLRRALEADSSLGSEQLEGIRAGDIDEWVLDNERALRDDQRKDWRHGLVDWASHAAVALPDSTLTSSTRVLNRAKKESGYTFLDELRAPSVATIASVEDFRTMFSKISDRLLDGLDWANVFVAGGIVLSTLLCVDEEALSKHTNSDIDVYIYGLGPREANEKIKHIFDTWKGNLPAHAKDKTIVVRNSRTITFFSDYPIKRLQIVLKLVKHPKEVLLNFDLDICSMGFDGSSLWLLPRAARALETGYNVFTMNLIEGHFLGERRASQESRVFKYADKGYGIRILPSYVGSLPTHVVGNGPSIRYAKPDTIPTSDLHIRANRGIKWTLKGINRYLRYGHGSDPSQRDPDGRPEFTHAMLEERCITSTEPGDRSCLTGFELFIRHVELWREKIRGRIAMSKESWVLNNYDVGPTGYDDSPLYTWDATFDFKAFEEALEEYNAKDAVAFFDNLDDLALEREEEPRYRPTGAYISRPFRRRAKHFPHRVKRISWAPELSGVLSSEGDNVLLLFVADGFVQFANDTIRSARKDHSLESDVSPLRILETVSGPGGCRLDAVMWTVDSTLAWQQIDRRIDEVNEILWSFYRSHNYLKTGIEHLTRKFFTEVSRRAIRPTPTDEFVSFARWIARTPPPIGYSCGGLEQGFFGWSDSEDEEEGWDDEPFYLE